MTSSSSDIAHGCRKLPFGGCHVLPSKSSLSQLWVNMHTLPKHILPNVGVSYLHMVDIGQSVQLLDATNAALQVGDCCPSMHTCKCVQLCRQARTERTASCVMRNCTKSVERLYACSTGYLADQRLSDIDAGPTYGIKVVSAQAAHAVQETHVMEAGMGHYLKRGRAGLGQAAVRQDPDHQLCLGACHAHKPQTGRMMQ